jgi:hypothetical protein
VSATPKPGDVRVRSEDGSAVNAIPEVFDGSSWVMLRGVVSIDLHVDARTLPLLTITMYPSEMEFYTEVERVVLRRFEDEISRHSLKQSGKWP